MIYTALCLDTCGVPMFRAKSSCRCWHFHYWMSPYRRADDKQEQACRCLVLVDWGSAFCECWTAQGQGVRKSPCRWCSLGQLFLFAGLPPGVCWLKAYAVMLAFFALYFGQFAHLQCQCRRRQGAVSNFARSLQARRPTLNQARAERRWRHRALALWLVHEAKDEETQIVCAAWLGRHFESWNLESRSTVFSNLFCKADSASVTVTCQSIPQAWDAATKARQNWTYPGRCRFICRVILDAFVWSFAWFESFVSIFPTSYLSSCQPMIHLYSFISFIWWFVWWGSAWWWQCHIAAGAFCHLAQYFWRKQEPKLEWLSAWGLLNAAAWLQVAVFVAASTSDFGQVLSSKATKVCNFSNWWSKVEI